MVGKNRNTRARQGRAAGPGDRVAEGSALRRLRRDTRGASFVEFMLITGLVGIVAFVAWPKHGTADNHKVEYTANCGLLNTNCSTGSASNGPSAAAQAAQAAQANLNRNARIDSAVAAATPGNGGDAADGGDGGGGFWNSVGNGLATAGSTVWSFGKGVVVDGLWGTVTGLWGVVTHPIDTVSNLWTAVTHPVATWNAVTDAIGKAWDEDPARVIGAGVFEVITLPIAAIKVGKVGKVAKVTKVLDELDNVTDVAKIADKADDLADVGKVADKVDDVADVGKAGNKAEDFGKIKGAADAPAVYKADPRWDELVKDPAHGGKVTPTSTREAMAALEAEKQGLLGNGVRRGTAEIDIYDGKGVPYDVKAPPSPPAGAKWTFDPAKSGDSILKQVKKTDPDGKPIQVLLDKTYMNDVDYKALKDYLAKNGTPEELGRITEVTTRTTP